MNGCVIPGTPIAVDTWKIRQCSGAKLFFLTHLHGDHIVGLTSSWDRPLYCSHITAEILKKRYQIKPEYVHPLHANDSHLLSGDQSEDCQEYVSVTLIDANHCPGAVMFLFEGSFGKILHTGDFRYDDSMMDSELKNHLGTIDVMYLDNTYCDPQCVFPSRNHATQEILDIVNRHKNHDVVFGIRSLGKEDLLVKIAVETSEWISVPGNILEVAETLNLRQVFLTVDDPTPHRLRVVPFSSVSSKNVSKWTSEKPTIVILPTSLYVGINGKPFANHENVFVVPYSDHSSYLELVKFVSQVQPKRIVPIVRANSRGPFGVDISSRADMSCFDKFLSKADPSQEHVVKRRKLNSGEAVNVQSFQDLSKKMSDTNDIQVTKRKVNRKLFKQKVTKNKVKGVQFDSNSESTYIEITETSLNPFNPNSEIFNVAEGKLQNSTVLENQHNFVKEHSKMCESENENNIETEKQELPLNELDKSKGASVDPDCLGVALSEALESKSNNEIEKEKLDQPSSKYLEELDVNTIKNGSSVDNLFIPKQSRLQRTPMKKCVEDNISIKPSIKQCLSYVNSDSEELMSHECISSIQEAADLKENTEEENEENNISVIHSLGPDRLVGYQYISKGVLRHPESSYFESEKKTIANETNRIKRISGNESENEPEKTEIGHEKCPRDSTDVSVVSSLSVSASNTAIESPHCNSVLNNDGTYRNNVDLGFPNYDSETHQLSSENIVLSVKKYSKSKSKKNRQQEFYKCLENCLQRAEEYANSSASSE